MSDDDDNPFQAEMRRLGIKNQPSDRRPQTPKPKTFRRPDVPTSRPQPQAALTPRTFVTPETTLSFQRSGIQHTMFAKLKRGVIVIEGRLDLHRLTSSEAMARLDRFLDQAQEQGLRCVIIVHGKGLSSQDGKPILKSLVNEHLREDPRILAFHSAQNKHGGRGAIYTLIKKKS